MQVLHINLTEPPCLYPADAPVTFGWLGNYIYGVNKAKKIHRAWQSEVNYRLIFDVDPHHLNRIAAAKLRAMPKHKDDISTKPSSDA